MKIMTPKHPQWEDFCKRLEGPEGCNFMKNSEGKTIWKCGGGGEDSKAAAILAKMGFDVQDSLAFFREHGGFCDCEILFNVAA